MKTTRIPVDNTTQQNTSDPLRSDFFNHRRTGTYPPPACAIAGLCLLLSFFFIGVSSAFGQNTVKRDVISGGGGTTGNTGHIVRGTLSQTAIGRTTYGKSERHDVGFWYWAYRPEIVATVSIPEIEANVGNRLTIPLQLTTSQLRGSFFPRGFRARIRFNSTLIHLTQNSMVCSYDGDDCVVEFTGTAQAENGTIAELDAVATLGNDLSTPMIIEEFEWEARADERTLVTKEDGELRLLDVCREGDQIRLIHSGTAASRLRVWPNPAGEETTLEFVANESGPAEIRLVNVLGSDAGTLVKQEIEADRIYQSGIDLRELPSGSYIVVYRTATQTLTERLLIRH